MPPAMPVPGMGASKQEVMPKLYNANTGTAFDVEERVLAPSTFVNQDNTVHEYIQFSIKLALIYTYWIVF